MADKEWKRVSIARWRSDTGKCCILDAFTTLVKLAPDSTLSLRIRYSTWVGRDLTWVRCTIEFCVEWHSLRRGSPIEKCPLTRKYCFSGPIRGVFLVRIRYSTWVGRDLTWVRCRIEFCVEWHSLRRGSPIEKWVLTRKYCISGPIRGVFLVRIRYFTWVSGDWTWVRCRIEFCVEWHTLRRGSPIEKWVLTRKYCISGPIRGVFLVRIRYSTWVSGDWTWVRCRIEFCVDGT